MEAIFTVEWSYPYCTNPNSGPAFPVTGMPLPYKIYSGVSSVEYFFMPHVYAANLLLLAAMAYPIIRQLGVGGSVRAGVVGFLGLGCKVLVSASLILSLSIRSLIPVGTIVNSGFMKYQELRPISFGFSTNSAAECKASHFWFPQGWQPR